MIERDYMNEIERARMEESYGREISDDEYQDIKESDRKGNIIARSIYFGMWMACTLLAVMSSEKHWTNLNSLEWFGMIMAGFVINCIAAIPAFILWGLVCGAFYQIRYLWENFLIWWTYR